MGKAYRAICTVAFFLLSVSMWGQTTVTGRVTDDQGEPLIGVSVIEEGSTNGAVTDEKGNYKITVYGEDPELSYHYIGFESRKVSVNGRSKLNVVMNMASTTLDDVVVIGYGTQKKVNVTGAVTAINFDKQIAGRPILTPTTALSGLVAGMNVSQTSGNPNADETVNIRLRGIGTFSSAGSAPLVLVDGIEWSMDNVNPNDIASISVLKDAASTAIYGTRAANGVILVTTKTGEGARPSVTYSYGGTVQMPYNNMKFVNNYPDYMRLMNEAAHNVGKLQPFSQSTIGVWEAANANPNGLNEYGVPNYIAYPNTDWFEELFQTGYSQNHNISVSGSGDRVKYLISLGYMDNQGIMNRFDLDSSTQKINFRTNLEAKITEWLKIGTRIIAQKQDYGLTNTSTGFENLYMSTPGMYPGEPGYWGKPASQEDNPQSINVFSNMSGRGGYNTTWRVNGTMYAVLNPFKGFSVEGTFNYSPSFKSLNRYTTKGGAWNYVMDIPISESDIALANNTQQHTIRYNMSAELVARYNTTIAKDHSLGALVGYSAINNIYQGQWQYAKRGATDWSLHEMDTYAELYSSSSKPYSSWGLRSYFARVNYSYKDRYLFEANFRADGSSRFGRKSRYGFFPSASAGWRISEEEFMQGTSHWLSSLKLRASWGRTGNNNIGNYAWQSTYSLINVVVDGKPTQGLYPAALSNENLHWETTTTTDIGVDFAMFDNRFTGELDYYHKMTSDILYTPPIYETMGFVGGVPSNAGKMLNQGVELDLKWNDSIGSNFSYYVGVNVSFNRNEVKKFKGKLEKYWQKDANGNPVLDKNGDPTYYNNLSAVTTGYAGGLLCEGRMIGEYYMRKVYRGNGKGYTGGAVDLNAGPVDGIIRTESDMKWVRAMIESGYSFMGKDQILRDQFYYGDMIYQDLDGDKNYGDDDDRDFTGTSATPISNIGINLGFACYGFDFNMVWAGALGQKFVWRASTYNSTKASLGHGLMQHIADDHYFYDPDNPDDPRTNLYGSYPRLTYEFDSSSLQASDYYEYDGSYLKLRNVQLGYTLPQHISKKFFVKKLRVYASLDNMLTITKYPGLDPEIGTAMTYPLMRQISFGAQVTF